ncbi:MAG TPA: response regulator [Thermoanaerobaculia bacterium]|jgi:CheY-like chemotaxis protein|nr:response regulator [Thermoanaerobaculia bacterium]
MQIEEKRLLVVDDDDAIRALLFTVLRRRGLKVDTARNGIEATERCARCRYAVMLLDLMMPRMSGYEVLERLENMPPEQRPFVIVLTAGNEPRQLNPDIVAGTVRKPFDIELLLDTVLACMTTLRALEQAEDCPPADSDVPVVNVDKTN